MLAVKKPGIASSYHLSGVASFCLENQPKQTITQHKLDPKTQVKTEPTIFTNTIGKK